MPTVVTVLKMPASFHIPVGQHLKLISDGHLVRFISDEVVVAGVRAPQGLIAEVTGEAPTLFEELTAHSSAALVTSHVNAFLANAHSGFPEIELAYDVTPGATKRDFFQRRLVPAPSPFALIPGRPLEPKLAGPFHQALAEHPERNRILAVINHYTLALDSWRPGLETLALASLWMAVENLTGCVMRQHLSKSAISEDDLIDQWRLDGRKRLRPAVREKLIFKGDTATYKKAKEASDAFEHGLMDSAAVRSLAQEVHAKVADLVRAAVFELIEGLDATVRATFLSSRFQPVRGPLLLDKYLFGQLLQGDSQQLAAPGERYPHMGWSEALAEARKNDDGTWSCRLNDTFTPSFATGVSLTLDRCEIWDASVASRRVASEDANSAPESAGTPPQQSRGNVKRLPWETISGHSWALLSHVKALVPPPPINSKAHYFPALSKFWRSVRLYEGALRLLNEELPEEACILLRSLFEESLQLQQLTDEPELRDGRLVSWIRSSIAEKRGLLLVAVEIGQDDDVSKQLAVLEDEERELRDYCQRHQIRQAKFRPPKDAALRFKRNDDYWMYEFSHEAVHGSDAVWMFARRAHGDTLGLHAKTSELRIRGGVAEWGASSMVHVAESTARVFDWGRPDSIRKSWESIREVLESELPDSLKH